MFNFINRLVDRFYGIFLFLALAIMVTIISLIVFGAAQQVYRQSANDPQVEATESIADALIKGVPADAIVGSGNELDLTKSLGVFVIIFDKDGKVVTGSGKLDGNVPTPPSGVFDYVRQHNQDLYTWEPKKNVRLATAVLKLDGDKGFVLAGKSLRLVEQRTQRLFVMIGIAWILLLIGSVKFAWLLSRHRLGNLAVLPDSQGNKDN